MKALRWIVIIALGLSIGASVAAKRNSQAAEMTSSTDGSTTADRTASNQAISSDANASVSSDGQVVPSSPGSNQPGSTPPAEPTVAVVPALAAIAYKPAANEQASFKTIQAFYQAYNKADESGVVAQFDLSVSVTAAVKAALAAGQARPIKVTISRIETRSDDSQLAVVQEVRSDSDASLAREIELSPSGSNMMIVTYRSAQHAEATGGFLTK